MVVATSSSTPPGHDHGHLTSTSARQATIAASEHSKHQGSHQEKPPGKNHLFTDFSDFLEGFSVVATRVLGGSYEGFAEDDQNPRVLSGSYEGVESPKEV